MTRPRPGDVYQMDLGDPVGHEQGFRRPGVIISPEYFNSTSSNIAVIMPLTSRDRGIPSHRPLNAEACGLDRPSWVRTEDVRSVSQDRFGRCLGRISPDELNDLKDTLMVLLDL